VFWPSSKFKLTTVQGITYLDAVSGASRSDKLVLKNVEAIEFSDKVVSLEIADRYVNTPSKDNFDGGPGIDTVVYDKPISNYVVVPGVNGIEVSSANYSEGSDWLLSIERLQFKDKGLAFDLDGRAGVAAKTLGLIFGQEAVSVPKYMGICLDYLDNKQMTAAQLMHEALAVRLGADAQNTEKLVSFLYERLTGMVPIQSEKDKYVGWITSGAYTADSLAVYASGLSLNPVVTQLTGMATTGIAFEMPS
jgi:serralysin